MFDPARPGRFAPVWTVVVLLAALVSLAVNVGPGVSALVAHAAHRYDAPVAAQAAQVAPVSCEEDQPCWDPATMGNGLAGATWDASGSIVCPARMVPWDTGDPSVGTDGVLCRTTVVGPGMIMGGAGTGEMIMLFRLAFTQASMRG